MADALKPRRCTLDLHGMTGTTANLLANVRSSERRRNAAPTLACIDSHAVFANAVVLCLKAGSTQIQRERKSRFFLLVFSAAFMRREQSEHLLLLERSRQETSDVLIAGLLVYASIVSDSKYFIIVEWK